LRVAGAVIVAKTNMSEFAYSGVGLNPHYGTPANPADHQRVPGGSSSGAAVSVAEEFCDIAIGTDTGGSLRIPAALCGLVGFKPTQSRVPLEGTHPLSYSLDSIGPIAKTVDLCARAFAVLSGGSPSDAPFPTLRGLRLGAVQGMPLEQIDQTVGEAYESLLKGLSAAGVIVVHLRIPELEAMVELNKLGGLVAAEAYFIHRELMENGGSEIDPNIRRRLERGRPISASDYLQMIHRRRDLAVELRSRMQHLDALIMPTTPIVAPTFEEVGTPEGFDERNLLLLRNTAIANFFGLASISLPIPGTRLPVGLMLTAGSGEDERLLSMARTVEAFLQGSV
jgi:aspartyl-tRNA(Asn)/glutamyl-tRNA(Gln) amidotransferase subunit A